MPQPAEDPTAPPRRRRSGADRANCRANRSGRPQRSTRGARRVVPERARRHRAHRRLAPARQDDARGGRRRGRHVGVGRAEAPAEAAHEAPRSGGTTMTSLPDWLVERAALDEVAPISRDRITAAEPRELAERIAAVREDNAAELARHPARPAGAQIEARIAAETRRRSQRRRRLGLLGVATSAAAILLVARFGGDRPVAGFDSSVTAAGGTPDEVTRVKGAPRLVAFRQVGEQAERLEPDALVHAGDLIQLRYNPGGKRYGLIASVDGAGVVTLHFPFREDAPPEATAVSAETTTLPHAYALDDAPGFERFFFITANGPIDVPHSLAALRSLARRADSATASLELPAGVRQWSLSLRKPDRPSTNHESP